MPDTDTLDAAPALEQATLDRMARNRAEPARRTGSLSRAGTVPSASNVEAFRTHDLEQAVTDARDDLIRAECARRAVTGRLTKEKLRPAVLRARAKLNAAERALATEARGAAMADAVLRTDQVQRGGPMDGVTLRHATVIVPEAGRVEQVTALGRLIRDKSLTPAQGAALVRYRDAHEAAEAGLYGGGLNPDATGGGSPASGNARVENAVADGIMLAKMRAALFPRGVALIEHVVVHGLTVTSWALRQVTASRTGMDPKRAMGLLEAAADVLVGVK